MKSRRQQPIKKMSSRLSVNWQTRFQTRGGRIDSKRGKGAKPTGRRDHALA